MDAYDAAARDPEDEPQGDRRAGPFADPQTHLDTDPVNRPDDDVPDDEGIDADGGARD